MFKKIAITTLLVSGLSTGNAIADERDKRFYGAIMVGSDSQKDENIEGQNGSGQIRDLDLSFDSGQFISVSFGVKAVEADWGRIRVEAELSQREGDMNELVLNGTERRFRPGSHVSLNSTMLNVFYDTPKLGFNTRAFVGAGFGQTSMDHEIRYLVERPASAGGNLGIAIPSSETTSSYQLIGGLEWELNDSFSLLGDVRYLELGDSQVERFNVTAGALDSVLDADKSTTTVSAGIRYSF